MLHLQCVVVCCSLLRTVLKLAVFMCAFSCRQSFPTSKRHFAFVCAVGLEMEFDVCV